MRATLPLLLATDFPAINRAALTTLQVNLGYRCNQTCLHCHVNAGPTRTEMMSLDTMHEVLALARSSGATTLDLTGGAPELNEHFRYLVRAARAMDMKVIDRCNLTVLFEPGQEGLAEFLAEQKVEICASLPCYSQKNVDQQRGEGVFDKSIHALQLLNALGYAKNSDLVLNLVYNPQGPSLPPAQDKLEADYKRLLLENFGVEFTRLFTITNMPIQRFGSTLVTKGQFADYMQLLRSNYQTANLEQVMCRSLVSIDYQGYAYDCDFNQMLGLQMGGTIESKGPRLHIRDLMAQPLLGQPIRIADHCYGCTAGQGSSCAGAL